MREISKIEKKKYLAQRIANCIGATIAEEKPATMIRLTNANRKNKVFELWSAFGKDLFGNNHLSYYELRKSKKEKSVIILFFCQCKMNKVLQEKGVKNFLAKLGYKTDRGFEEILSLIKKRYSPKNFFPPEIGILLGIPLKDVKGFMGLSPLPYRKTEMWRIYGKEKESLKLMKRYRRANNRIRKKLLSGEDPLEIINGVKAEKQKREKEQSKWE